MNINLKSVRKASGMTQGALAKALDIDIKTVGNWERGNSYPNAEQIWNCAVALGCSPNDILGWAEEQESDLEDVFEHELLDCYRASTPSRQDRILDTARDAAGMSKETTEHAAYEPKQQAAC